MSFKCLHDDQLHGFLTRSIANSSIIIRIRSNTHVTSIAFISTRTSATISITMRSTIGISIIIIISTAKKAVLGSRKPTHVLAKKI